MVRLRPETNSLSGGSTRKNGGVVLVTRCCVASLRFASTGNNICCTGSNRWTNNAASLCAFCSSAHSSVLIDDELDDDDELVSPIVRLVGLIQDVSELARHWKCSYRCIARVLYCACMRMASVYACDLPAQILGFPCFSLQLINNGTIGT